MLREEEKDQAPGGSWKTYSRSMSWTECPPRKSTSKPLWNSKARACLPPLQPLSIIRPSIEEWPKAGSDDIGMWPCPSTPRPGSVTPRKTSTSDLPSRESEYVRERCASFHKECSRVLGHIYLGCNAVAKDREILRSNGITHVLNCVGHYFPDYFKEELVYRTLWLQDCPSEDISCILYDVFDYFEEVCEQGGRVLVHCCRGVSRSTSLVIAYLMWKQGMSFTDAFQHVRAAREVADPNVGFACQLMQCQKRIHALPPSPTSLIRVYRMAPHSPYDPLHLVAKMVADPSADRLDSRGAFIIQVPWVIFVWVGRHCTKVMSDAAATAVSQVIRYEKAQGRVVTVREGEEASEFWGAFSFRKGMDNGSEAKSEEVHKPESEVETTNVKRSVAEFDNDFQMFQKAFSGGVAPPFPVPESESETCLPVRESGWNSFKRKHAKDLVKDLVICSKLNPRHSTTPSSDHHSDSYFTCSSNWTNDSLPLTRSPSFSLVESLSSFYLGKQKSDSPSPSLSPSTPDYSSTFSPSSSNCSDMSSASALPSPYRLEPKDTN
ncbi:hypothetical protein M569_02917, partial [Genlisea aurea]